MKVTEKINNCNIAYDTEYTHSIREYYLYCISLFKEHLQYRLDLLNIIFGDLEHEFENDFPTKRVAFQYEHTLVKPGGRDSDGFKRGKIPIKDSDDFYLVRLANKENLERSDLIIEYSMSNFSNVVMTDYYPHYNGCTIHISACLYDVDFGANSRHLDVTTNFYDVNQPRRYTLLEKLKTVGAQNYTGQYGRDLATLYRMSSILVNVHQTDHHDTLEELRVLPALRRGAIVVAEESALQSLIPFKDHIVWAQYNEIPIVVNWVRTNYKEYRDRIFNDALLSIFRRIEESNRTQIERGLCILTT